MELEGAGSSQEVRHRPSSPLSDHRALGWLPWTAGPEQQTAGPVLVSLTEFVPRRARHLASIGWTGMRLRAGWYGLPGAVGLYLWVDPWARSVGSLSIWTNAADLQRWIALPLHAEVMRRYRRRSVARSTQWTSERFDRGAIRAEARRLLTGG